MKREEKYAPSHTHISTKLAIKTSIGTVQIPAATAR